MKYWLVWVHHVFKLWTWLFDVAMLQCVATYNLLESVPLVQQNFSLVPQITIVLLIHFTHQKWMFCLMNLNFIRLYVQRKYFSSSFPMFDLLRGCRDGAVVRALTSHQRGPGSIPRSGVKCGLSLLVLYSAARGFLWELQKPKFDLIVLIVNFSYSVPSVNLSYNVPSARTTRH